MNKSKILEELVAPMLDLVDEATREARAVGLNDDEVDAIVAVTVMEVCFQVENYDDRKVLMARLAKVRTPTHRAPSAVQ